MIGDIDIGRARELAARLRMDLIDPREVAAWAVEQLASEDPPSDLVDIAVLDPPIRHADVDRLLTDYLNAVGQPILDDEEAGMVVSVEIARRIIAGNLDPFRGARTIWWDVLSRVQNLRTELIQFVELASEWEEDPQHRAEYEQEIVEEARRLVARRPDP